MAKGIDYGNGLTNIDHSNGIRYGVIPANEVLQAWCDSSEPDYGEPHCPKCGNAGPCARIEGPAIGPGNDKSGSSPLSIGC